MAIFPTGISTDADLYVALDNFGTTLNGAIDNSQTTITLTSTTGLPTVGILTVDSEKVKYTGVSGFDVTGCTRGFSSTSAAAHLTGATVEFNVIEEHHNTLKDEIIAVETHLGTNGTNVVHIAGTETLTGSKSFTLGTTFLSTTASTVPYLDASKVLVSSTITPTELSYLSGVTSAIQTQLGTKATDSLVVHLAGTETITGEKTFSNGQTFFANGTVALPTISFTSDPNTGIYTSSADQLDFATNGTQRFAIAATGLISSLGVHQFTTGSAAAPSISFSGDPNTGIYNVSADYMGFSTGGAVRAAVSTTSFDFGSTIDVSVSSTKKLYLDGTGDSYWIESSSNVVDLFVNATKTIEALASGVAIRGTNTNDSATAGFVGEYIESFISAATNSPGSAAYFSVTSISLTAGDWDVSGVIRFRQNSATYSNSSLECGIGTADGNNSAGLSTPSTNVLQDLGSNTWVNQSLVVSTVRKSLSATTTIYLKGLPGTYSAGTPQYQGRISARRVR